MSRIKSLVVAISLVFAGMLTLVSAAEAQVQVVGAGSSAQWQATAYAAWHDLAGAVAGHHYTIKGHCTSGNCGQLKDQRSTSIPLEGGNLWVVWNSTATKFWAFLSVDSVVGNRCFKASPRCLLEIDAQTKSVAGQNLISTALWGADATALPAAVYAALNGQPITAGFTDIRPEDAKFAECRATSPLTSTRTGLGYGSSCTQLIGSPIISALSSATANPSDFNLSGTDPFTGRSIPVSTTIPVGASPIIFIVNRTNASGLGSAAVKNVTVTTTGTGTAQQLFEDEAACNASTLGGGNFPLTILLREPLSGTMNTTEFTNFRLVGSGLGGDSQEESVVPPTNNPLDQACAKGGGKRMRGIGTGEIVGGVATIRDSIGYAFFSYGNVAKISGVGKYLTVNGVDPIQPTYTNGTLPTCTAPCPKAAGTSFPNLRNGSYRTWSLLRVVTDASGANFTNVSALVSNAQNDVNGTVPDFVPFKTTNHSDPGLTLYRSHYLQSGVAPRNGLGGQTESGGDVGGCIEHVSPPPGVLNCHQ